MKYLYVEFINNWEAYCTMEMFGAPADPVKYRIVKVPLTDQQEEMLKPRVVGNNKGKMVLETIRLVSVQDND